MGFNSGEIVGQRQKNRSTSNKKNSCRKEIRFQQNANTNIYNPVFILDDSMMDVLENTRICKLLGANSDTDEDTSAYRIDARTFSIGKSSSSTKTMSMKAWKRKQNKLRDAVQTAIEDSLSQKAVEAQEDAARRAAKAARKKHDAQRAYQRNTEQEYAERRLIHRRAIEQWTAERIPKSLSFPGEDCKKINKYNSVVERILEVYESGSSLFICNACDRPTGKRFFQHLCSLQEYREINKYYDSMEMALEAFAAGCSFFVSNECQLPI